MLLIYKFFRNSKLCLFFLFLFFPNIIFSQNITSPEKFLGFAIGSDYKLATYEQAINYFRILEKESRRIKLYEIGKTSMGKSMIYAVITSEENMLNIEKYKEISKKLSLIENLKEDEARKFASEGKAVVYIDGGLHASECAPAQHNIQLAYELISGNDPETITILNNVILVLVFANPDGMDIVADWYYKNLGTPYETSPLPWLYHKYVGHDNNRDSYIANMIETQHLTSIVNKEWFPVILYNHHQTAPFPARIWIPPDAEPTNPNVHPSIIRWKNLIGSAMGAEFDKNGLSGAISRIVYDTWYPGYVTQVVDSHNIISILTETALYNYATPHFYTVRDFPATYRDLTISAFYPNPWKGGWWRIGDAVNYCLTASKAVLKTAGKYREELLYNKYKMGKDIIDRFKNEPPYAWIIPQEQNDPPIMTLLLNKMILLGINVYQTKDSFICDGITYPTGTFVIPMTQPFALFVKNVFERQSYPDLHKYPELWQALVRPVSFNGSPLRSYDVAGWTLPLQMGVKAISAGTQLSENILLTKVEISQPKQFSITGSDEFCYIISHNFNNCFIVINRILKNKGKVFWIKNSFFESGKEYSSGTIIIPKNNISRNYIESIAKDLFIPIIGIKNKPNVEMNEIRMPNIGLYKSFVANVDEGWTRWLFEQYEIPFINIHNSEINSGNLNERFSVIVFPSQSPSSIIEGHKEGTMPPQYVGGIGEIGINNLKDFAKNGGKIITLNSSCNLPIDTFDIPVKNILKQIKPEEFFCTGSILKIKFDTKNPIAYGMTEDGYGMFYESPVFEIIPTFKKDSKPVVIGSYPNETLLLSGYINGEKIIKQKASVIEVPYGKGKIILIGFPAQYRGQSYGTFKLLFNSLYY
jgi:hypothetical protein